MLLYMSCCVTCSGLLYVMKNIAWCAEMPSYMWCCETVHLMHSITQKLLAFTNTIDHGFVGSRTFVSTYA